MMVRISYHAPKKINWTGSVAMRHGRSKGLQGADAVLHSQLKHKEGTHSWLKSDRRWRFYAQTPGLAKLVYQLTSFVQKNSQSHLGLLPKGCLASDNESIVEHCHSTALAVFQPSAVASSIVASALRSRSCCSHSCNSCCASLSSCCIASASLLLSHRSSAICACAASFSERSRRSTSGRVSSASPTCTQNTF